MFPFCFEPFQRERLLTNCRCGNALSHVCPEVGLHNHRSFPPFNHLPLYEDLDEEYYEEDEISGIYSPSRHWAFVGEIVEIQTDWIRPRVLLQSKFGEQVLVNFHLDTSPSPPTFFGWEQLKKGSTMCIFYALNKQFADTNRGIRQEDPDSAMIFPASLDLLSQEIDLYSNDGSSLALPQRCFSCGEKGAKAASTSSGGALFRLRRCATCKLAVYCDRACQSLHWRNCHRKLCAHASKLSSLARFNFENFVNHVDWSFNFTPPLTAEVKIEMGRDAVHEFMRRAGVEPLSQVGRCQRILDIIWGKSITPDDICGSFFDESTRKALIMGGQCLETISAKDTFLYQSLSKLIQKVVIDPQTRYFVVDLNSNADILKHEVNNALFNIMQFAIPQWQHDARIPNVSWAFEAHDLLVNDATVNMLFPSPDWNVKAKLDDGTGIDSLLVTSPYSCMFCADNMSIVAGVAAAMAKEDTNTMVIRVLRATGILEEYIREIVADSDTPDNLYTLWIREEVPSCGIFRTPINPDLGLLDQLLDITPVNPLTEFWRYTETLLQENLREGSSTYATDVTAIEQHPSNNTTSNKFITCASCEQRKASPCYSKNQLRKGKGVARCKTCIERALNNRK